MYHPFCYPFEVNALRPSQQYFNHARTFARVESVLSILLRDKCGIRGHVRNLYYISLVKLIRVLIK